MCSKVCLDFWSASFVRSWIWEEWNAKSPIDLRLTKKKKAAPVICGYDGVSAASQAGLETEPMWNGLDLDYKLGGHHLTDERENKHSPSWGFWLYYAPWSDRGVPPMLTETVRTWSWTAVSVWPRGPKTSAGSTSESKLCVMMWTSWRHYTQAFYLTEPSHCK